MKRAMFLEGVRMYVDACRRVGIEPNWEGIPFAEFPEFQEALDRVRNFENALKDAARLSVGGGIGETLWKEKADALAKRTDGDLSKVLDESHERWRRDNAD